MQDVQISESTKIALIEADKARIATLRALPPVTKERSTPPPLSTRVVLGSPPHTSLGTPSPERGKIIQDIASPFPSSSFLPENKWVLRENERLFEVFAGREGSHDEPTRPPYQGMMAIVIWNMAAVEADPLAKQFISTRFYPTPSKDGPARIEDAEVRDGEMYLTISTAGGSRFVFHVNDGSYRSLTP